MTNTQKVTVWFVACIIIFLWFVLYTLVTKVNMYESALDNTVDATIMEIDNVKLQIKARNIANDKDRQMICNKLIPKLKNNVPQKYIEDGTCEL